MPSREHSGSASGANAIITLDNVAMEYDPGKEILRGVSFSIPAGSFHFLTGPSGAGKSSLLSLLGLSHGVSRGKLEMFGRDVTHLPREELPLLRRRIGMVFQDFRLLNHLTVAENIALPLKVIGEKRSEIMARVEELLHWVELDAYANAMPESLSGGEKQRVAIARAVITQPDLILADEPTGNLDPALSRKFLYLFEALHKLGTTIIFATHDESLLSQSRHPTLQLETGKVKIAQAKAA
jgi:cell division transport system ATP-binding protein